ncbi:MAG: glutamate--tRNA ligase [Candidatus Omnitrophota bacterium]
MTIRTRFAPSPTGFLHIGGVRTALFCYLYARGQGGKFLLRIEDTDRERSEKRFEDNILESLKWLGLAWDEALVYQSQRLERYREYAAKLLAAGQAYEVEEEGRKAVRFRFPKKEVIFTDIIRETVKFDSSIFEDMVIMKSDGFPTYQFACVVDDHEMEISHVIRGEDHLSNTPRQILVYEALGWKPPKFAHLPLIHGQDGTPLSKRHGAVALSAYREQGYLPEGLLNYLALLGWGSSDNQEVFTLAELVKKFSLKKVTKSAACFDRTKLGWINGQHLRKLSAEDYLARLTAFWEGRMDLSDAVRWKKIALLYRARIENLGELEERTRYLSGDIGYEDKKFLDEVRSDPVFIRALEAWIGGAEGLGGFSDLPALEQMTRRTAEKEGLEAKALIHPLRYVLTGQTATPGLFEVMELIGKETCLARAKRFLRGEGL